MPRVIEILDRCYRVEIDNDTALALIADVAEEYRR